MTTIGHITENLLGRLDNDSHDFSKRAMYGGTSRRTYQPIRKHSYLKGREGAFWRGISRKDVKQIVLAAKRYELSTKQAGKRQGALGGVAIEILEYFSNLVDFKTGRLDPAITTLMDKLCRSRDAIVRALKALRTHGFLDWVRRYIPADDPTGRIKVQQTSNAYRLSLPNRAKKLLGRYGQTAPLSCDAEYYEQEKETTFKELLSQLSLSERPQALVEDDAMSRALSRLGALIEKDNRESGQRTESLSKSINNINNAMP